MGTPSPKIRHAVSSNAQRASAPGEEALRLERLVSELSASFISLPAASIDSAIVDGLRRVVEALHIDRSTLSSISPDTAQFHCAHSWVVYGLTPVPPGTSSRDFPWVLARMRAGVPIVFSRLDELPPEASLDRASFLRIELRSHVALPVVVAGELVAVLGFATLREERTWSDELVSRLRLVAEIFASALARKRAHDDVERALGFERLLVDISATLLRESSGDLDAAITAALRDIGEFLRVERVLLRSLNFDGSRFDTTHLWVASGVDAPPYIIDRATAPVLFERISSGRVVALSSLDELPPEADTDRELLRRLGIRSGLIAPLAVDGFIVGALSLSSVSAERVWPETLIPRVQLIGEVFASVLTRERHATQMRDAQSETAQYRERLAHLVRVHTVGEMSAAIAHEVNQPLVAIENYAQAARRRLASENGIENEKLAELLEKIGQQAARAGDVIKRLRSIVRKQESEVTQFDLGATIASAINLVEMETRLSDIRIESAVTPGLPSVLADEIQIQQVVLNLARNAIEAMDSSATADKVLRIELQPVGERDLVVRVIDRGKGVNPDDEGHIFEPFYSTKVTGLGIGLAICRSIVEAHGGTLSYLANPDGGAIFQFTLPVVDSEAVQ